MLSTWLRDREICLLEHAKNLPPESTAYLWVSSEGLKETQQFLVRVQKYLDLPKVQRPRAKGLE